MSRKNIKNGALFIILTFCLIIFYNPLSLIGYVYYLLLGLLFVCFWNYKFLDEYIKYFAVNAFMATLFIAIQSHVYSDSYGTTSILGSSTDDNYFFSLLADKMPINMFIERNFYFEYTSAYTDLIKFLTFHKIEFPIDVIFFNSIVASFLIIFTGKVVSEFSCDPKSAIMAKTMTMLCPYYLMNGGAIIVRDTLVATLFVISLYSVVKKNYIPVFILTLFQFYIRPGTGVIVTLLLSIYLVFLNINSLKRLINFSIFFALFTIVLYFIAYSQIESFAIKHSVNLFGREIYEDLNSDFGENRILLFILEKPFVFRVFFSFLYLFLYPFFDIAFVKNYKFFDLRTILVSIIYPIYAIWLNYRVFALIIYRKTFRRSVNFLSVYIMGLVLIGLYSIQTRHKTIVLPLLYISISMYPNLSGLSNLKRQNLIFLSVFWFLLIFIVGILK